MSSDVLEAMGLEEKPQRNWFWTVFWLTIITLLGLSLYITYLKVNQLKDKLHNDNGVIRVDAEFLEPFKTTLSELDKYQKAELSSTQETIDDIISKQVDQTFTPVYAQIPAVADFHYSIKGEYTELATMLSGKISNHMQTILFDDINFEEKLKTGNNKISQDFQNVMSITMEKINNKTQKSLDFTKRDMVLLSSVLHLTMKDINIRFDKNLMALRLGGSAIGAGLSVASLKLLSKAIAKKVMAKATAKGALKLAGIGGGAGTGCAMFAWGGPIGCGLGGLAGGIGAWLLVDKAIILTDEHLNRDDFEIQIKKLVDQQKLSIKSTMQANYKKAIGAIKQQNTDNFNKLKDMTPAQASAQ